MSPTGDNCWTLFLSTKNFKGPVCFFTPYFWSHSAEVNPELCRPAAGFAALGPEQALPDGDPVCAGRAVR